MNSLLACETTHIASTTKILKRAAGIVFLVTVVVLCALILLSHFNVIRVSQIVLYTPASLGILSAILGLTALALKVCSGSSMRQNQAPALNQIYTFSAQEEKEAELLTKAKLEGLSTPNSLPSEKTEPNPFLFQNKELRTLSTPQEAISCFTIFMGDFMSLNREGYNANEQISLSFLITQLEKMKIVIQQSNNLTELIHRLRIAYTIATYQAQLSKAPSIEAYKKGREGLSSFILETLQNEKSVLISSGYEGEPVGHALVIELFLEGEKVKGRVLNSGEGNDYHNSVGGESVKYDSLELAPVPLETLKQGLFLDLITDFKMVDLIECETDFEVEKKTGYSIHDIYEVLLPLWPGEIRHSQSKKHALQCSSSCSLRPYWIVIKEALGEEGEDIARIFLGIEAFELLLANTDFKTLDLARIEDALAKFNRVGVSLERKKRLSPLLRHNLLSISEKVLRKIKETKKSQRQNFSEKEIDLGDYRESTHLPLSLSDGVDMENTDDKGLSQDNSLPLFSKETFSNYIQTARALITEAVKNKQKRYASKLAHHVLLTIPNPSDSFWTAKQPEETIFILSELVQLLLQVQAQVDRRLLTTPNEALLYLKVLTISLSQAQMGGVPKEVVELFGIQIKMVLTQTAPLYSLTHPAYAKIFTDCKKIAQTFKGEGEPIQLLQRNDDLDLWAFDTPPFRSLAEIRKDKELNFLCTFLQMHPDLLKTRYQGVINKSHDLIKNLGGLYEVHSLSPNNECNITFYDNYCLSKPDWEPVRQLTLLRSLYHYFICSSYLTGDVYTNLRGGQRPPEGYLFQINCDFLHLFSDSAYKRYIQFGSYKPKDPLEPSKGLFLDTFCSLSEPIKKWLHTLFQKQNVSSQNQHLLTQKGEDLEQEFQLSALEIQQLLSIKTYDELMVPQLIGFFSRHFHHLQNPRFQAIFAHLLFSTNQEGNRVVLEEVMKSSSFVKQQLFTFLRLALSRTKTLGWSESHLFLIQIFAWCTRYLAEYSPKSKLLIRTVNFLQEQMKGLLANQKLSKEERGKIRYTLISCAPYLDHPALAHLLSICQEAKKIKPAKGYNGVIKNSLQWEQDYAIGNLSLQTKHSFNGMLPNWVLMHDDYIFDQNFYVTNIKVGLYQFYDQKGVLHRIATQGSSIRTYRKIDGVWYEYKNTSPFTKEAFPSDHHPCTDGYFTRNVQAWHSIENPKEVLIIPINEEKPLCKITEAGVFHPFSQEPLQLVREYAFPVMDHFSRLISKSEILCWKNEKEAIAQIEIPNYALTFQFADGKWISSQHPGYFLDEHPISPSFEPYSHYLILQNAKGKRLAILPNLGVRPKAQNALDIPTIEYQQLTAHPKIFSFALNKKGKVKTPENGESVIYLIYLAMRKHNYAMAKKLMNQVKRERPEWSEKWCLWIRHLEVESEASRDNHPEAISLRLQLRLMMQMLSSTSLTKQELMGLKRDYIAYIELNKHTCATPLSRAEELQIVDILFKNTVPFSEMDFLKFKFRAQALTETPLTVDKSSRQTSKNSKEVQHRRASFSWLDEKIEEQMWKHLTKPCEIAFLTRPGSAFINNFLYYYTVARHLSFDQPARQELQQLLRVTRTMEDCKLFSLHLLLMHVMLEPQKYPTIGELELRKHQLGPSLEKLAFNLHAMQIQAWSFSDKLPTTTHTPLLQQNTLRPTQPVSTHDVKLPGYALTDMDFTQVFAAEKILVPQPWAEREKVIQGDLFVLKEMKQFLNSCQDENPCVDDEFTRLKSGIKLKKKALLLELKNQQSPYILNQNKASSLLQHHEELYKQYQIEMDQKKEKILHLAHHYHDTLELEKNGKLLRPLSLRELIVYFGVGKDEEIYRSNPGLTSESLTRLKILLTEYLILATNQNQLAEMSAHIDDESAWTKLATAKRVYKLIENPHLLVFEYFGKIRLRQEQYDALIIMTGSEDNLELEARTGFGKSKVLIPLWLFLKSQMEKTAVMAVPSSLFISQHAHLKKVLGKSYDYLIVPLQFDRTQANDIKYLQRICDKLEDAQKKKKIILTTVQALHGMVNLALKESLSKGSTESEIKIQKQLRVLRKRIAMQISGFFDESKECFNIRQRYDYAVGGASSVDAAQISSACSLYRDLFISEKGVMHHYNFEFLPTLQSEKKETVLKDDYEKTLLPLFAQKIICRFKVPEDLKQAVLADLQGHYSKKCDTFYQLLSLQQLEEYDRLRKQLVTHLARTLFRKCEDGYAFSSGTRLATPFVDGVAKKTSEFSAVEDYIDFTIQANLKKPFTVAEIESFVNKLKIKALEIGLQDFEKTEEYQLLQRLTQAPLLEIEKEEYETITDLINTNLNIKLDFIEQTILPQIRIHKKKITSTSFNLIRAIRHIQAASGTVNPAMLPPGLKTLEDKTAVTANLIALWKNSKDRIFELSTDKPQQQLIDLLTKRAQEMVLIDVAGSFRELDLIALGKTILDIRKNVQGVLLYDEEGREFVYERASQVLVPRKESLLEIDELFIFIRKSKAIGTDIDIPSTAEAIVTIDRDSYRDQVLQGAGRMRKLSEGQIAGFALLKEDAELIFPNNEMLFKHLLKYIVCVQGKQKGDDAFYVLRLYLEDLIEASFWEVAEKLAKTQDVQVLFNALEAFLVKETQSRPLAGLYQQRAKLPANQAVQKLKEDVLTPIKTFCKKNPDWAFVFDVKKIEEQFEQFVDFSKLPKEISLCESTEEISHIEGDVATETENINEELVEQLSDIHLENEALSDKATELPAIRYKPIDPLPWDGNYMECFQSKPDLTLLNTPIYYSPNFKQVSEEEDANARVQKPADQILVYDDKKGRLKIMLLDLHDARAVMNHILALSNSSEKGNIYLLSGQNIIACTGQQPALVLNEENPQVISIHLIRKLFTASEQITQKEKNHLADLHQKSQKETESFRKELKRLYAIWPHLSSLAGQCKKIFAN